MKRCVITLTVALTIIIPLVMSKPGHSQTQEKPAQAQEKPKGNLEAGKAIYVKQCQKCHAAGGEGVPKMYKLVKATLVHLGSKQAQDKSDDEIRKSMTDGFGKMLAIKDPQPLTPEELDNVVAFTRTLKQ